LTSSVVVLYAFEQRHVEMRHSLLFAADERVRGRQLIGVHAHPLDYLSLVGLGDLAYELDHLVHCKVYGACLQVIRRITRKDS
jgi:hypothetical protein